MVVLGNTHSVVFDVQGSEHNPRKQGNTSVIQCRCTVPPRKAKKSSCEFPFLTPFYVIARANMEKALGPTYRGRLTILHCEAEKLDEGSLMVI